MEWFNVGKVVNTHGMKGEVRVISITDFPERRYQIGNQLFHFKEGQDTKTPLTVRSHRKHKQFDLLSFVGYDNARDVEPLKGGMLKISAEQRDDSELGEHEFYYDDIIGCHVFSEDGEKIGIVKEIHAPGANDVWVVQSEAHDKPLYIPYIEPVVKDVNIKTKRIVIHVMEGLIE